VIYSIPITTPKNTQEDTPLVTEIPIIKGVIHKVEFDFPPGNQFLHRLRLVREGAYILPSNKGGYFTTEGNIISYREHWEIKDEPLAVYVHSWNLDETYDHTVIVRLGILRKNIITPWLMTWRERLAGTQVIEE
jgi:hypothetical protein